MSQSIEVAPARAGRGWTIPVEHRVLGRERETVDTWTLELEPLHAEQLAPFEPGQFSMLYAFGAGDAPISVSGDLTGSAPLTHTIRAVGPVTRALCATDPGDVVGVRGPFGTSWPLQAAAGGDVVVIAGGLGLAPLRPALYELLAHRHAYGRALLLYGGRSPAELLYRDELGRWTEEGQLTVEVTVDSADPSWTGGVGVVPELVQRAAFDAGSAIAFVCGPEVMIRFAVRALRDRGLTSDRIHVSLERSMQCGTGHCGHCQLGPLLICRDGAVFTYDAVEALLGVREL